MHSEHASQTTDGQHHGASPESADDKLLDPGKLRFFRAEDGAPRLEIEGDQCYLRFGATRLFPITHRRGLISISDGGGDEIGVLRRLRDLPKPMRRMVLEELRKRYFVPQITYVHSLKDEFGVLYWDVETTRGRREFVVREPRDSIREFIGGKLQITDVDGNQFEVADIDALPGKGVTELYRLM